MTTSLVAVLTLLTLAAVEGLSIVPKLDLYDDSTSIGIKPEHHKEVTVPTPNPTEVKAILEVNLVHSDPKPTPQEVLICTLDGKCKLHPIEGNKKDDDDDEDKEVYKPVIVSEFDVDAEEEVKEGGNAKDDDNCKGKKTTTKVPVFVAHKGAAPDVLPLRPEYHPHRRTWTQNSGRLPVYYGLKLGPEFRQPDRVVFQPIEYAPLHPRRPDIPDHVTRGVGFRYPNPYGKFIPRDGVRTVITPFGRRSNQGGVYWTTPKVVTVDDKVDLVGAEQEEEVTSPDDGMKVVSKLGELVTDTQ